VFVAPSSWRSQGSDWPPAEGPEIDFLQVKKAFFYSQGQKRFWDPLSDLHNGYVGSGACQCDRSANLIIRRRFFLPMLKIRWISHTYSCLPT
jgi:hypothetical protein